MFTPLALNSRDNNALTEQIVLGIRQRVASEQLRAGSRLPSIRQFAEQHGVSRFTVVQAFDRLVAEGYLESRRGSGFYVRAQQRPAAVVSHAEVASESAAEVLWILKRYLQDSRPASFQPGAGWLPPAWLQGDLLRRSLRQLARQSDAALVRYGHAQGYIPLREQLAQRLSELGINASREMILCCYGVSHGLDLIGRALLKPGDVVLVDEPGYFNLYGCFGQLGARLIGVPRLAEGPDIDFIKQIVKRENVKLFITSSQLQNPTGSCISAAVAHQLLRLAEEANFMLVDDDIYGDFHPNPTQRLACLDQLERVIHISSFSKTLSGGLRVGYIACHQSLANQLLNLKLLSHFSGNELNERLVCQLLAEGGYRKHLQRLQRKLEAARQQCLPALSKMGLTLDSPYSPGFFIKAQLPSGQSNAAELASLALQQDILLAPGNLFQLTASRANWLRLNLGYLCEPGCLEKLAQLLDS